jgi:hypothetical protein
VRYVCARKALASLRRSKSLRICHRRRPTGPGILNQLLFLHQVIENNASPGGIQKINFGRSRSKKYDSPNAERPERYLSARFVRLEYSLSLKIVLICVPGHAALPSGQPKVICDPSDLLHPGFSLVQRFRITSRSLFHRPQTSFPVGCARFCFCGAPSLICGHR